MDMEKRSLRVGAAALCAAALIRLGAEGTVDFMGEGKFSPGVAAVLLFLETGRTFYPVSPRPPVLPAEQPTEEPAAENKSTEPSASPEKKKPAYAPGSRKALQVNNSSSRQPDLDRLLSRPLTWNLYGEGPRVLILHTHATESYEDTEGYRCGDAHKNMVSVGRHLAGVLEDGGIEVIHDETVHDEPSYNDSYNRSRETAEMYLRQYPTIELVLDLHRDAAENALGEQVAFRTGAGGESAARLMVVVGTDERGGSHPNWQDNFSLALKLQLQLEGMVSGICRPISLSPHRYNQDLCTGALLVEVGGTGNTHGEALWGAEILGRALLGLAPGVPEAEMPLE